ncbi:WAP four-disulfide core domain protein 2-like [Nothobranchius furzeri]|uniref:Perlwapin-like n=1 Tax=Nothobranchius furzeri TaxID=105023 RepID=A0A9D2XZ49_NOTFU|nr:perlwapin-like [Nothobranchius furzeri]
MAHSLMVAAMIVMTCAVEASYMVPNPGKPGECPAMFYTFLPAHKCHCDSDCPGKEKCCTYYHNSVCAPPVSTIPRCPMIRGVRVICIEQCSGNWDCKHHEICCFNGCGHVCMSPNREKPGFCGDRRFPRTCRGHSCHTDFQCYGDLKCCPTRCGRSCVMPSYWPID